jgi:hypothetical protein
MKTNAFAILYAKLLVMGKRNLSTWLKKKKKKACLLFVHAEIWLKLHSTLTEAQLFKKGIVVVASA